MELIRNDDGKNGVFTLMDKEKAIGNLNYVWAGDDKFIIDHTRVDNNYSGQGLGRKLVMAAVEYARKHNLKIIPLCPFAKKVFEKNKDIEDVLSL